MPPKAASTSQAARISRARWAALGRLVALYPEAWSAVYAEERAREGLTPEPDLTRLARPDVDDRLLVGGYLAGKSTYALGAEVGLSHKSVADRLAKAGIPRRSKGRYRL